MRLSMGRRPGNSSFSRFPVIFLSNSASWLSDVAVTLAKGERKKAGVLNPLLRMDLLAVPTHPHEDQGRAEAAPEAHDGVPGDVRGRGFGEHRLQTVP